MKRCVVTGASGLLGSHLVPLLARDWQVHAISRNPPAALTNRSIVWHSIDLSLEFEWSKLPGGADAVIYLAQSEHFREFPERALEIFEVNTAGALRFLDYARKSGAKTVIYASSGGVYGSGAVGVSEEAPIPARGDLGFYLSFGGVVTFPKALNVQEAARMTPADRLLIETDAPYLAPVPHRGKRNEPAFVVDTARRLAALRAVTLDRGVLRFALDHDPRHGATREDQSEYQENGGERSDLATPRARDLGAHRGQEVALGRR